MAKTTTYYSPFFPNVELRGAKGTTKPIITPGKVEEIDQKFGDQENVNTIIRDTLTQVNKDLEQLNEDLENIEIPQDTTPPEVPSGVSVVSELTDYAATLIITWTASTAEDIAGYEVDIKEDDGPYYTFVTGNSSYRLEGLKRNRLYTVRVRAYDKSGNKSFESDEITHVTARDTVPPGPVYSITAETAYETAFLSWTNPNDFDLARVDVHLYNTNNVLLKAVSVAATPSGRGTVSFTKIPKATNYYVLIYSVDTSGNSSNPVQSDVFTTAGGIDLNDFTPGLSPIKTVPSLPNPVGYVGPYVVFNQQDGKLYNYVNGAWVSSTGIEDNSITSEKLVNGAVITDKLADYSINAIKLGTGAVTAEKMLIGDTTNYVENADFSQGGKGWILQNGATFVTGQAGNAYRGDSYGYANSFAVFRNNALMNVNEKDELYAYAWLNQTGTSNSYVRISGYDKDGVEVHTVAGNTVPASGAHGRQYYRKSEVSTIIPASVIKARVEVVNTTGGGELFVGMTGMFRRATGELIVDGVITASKIAANAITAEKIAANSIAANKLVIASRPVSTNINIRIDNDNIVRWDAGTITIVGDSGTVQNHSITAGAYDFADGTYALYLPGRTYLDFTTDSSYLSDPNHIKIAYRASRKDLTVYAGVSTIINGDRIVTGSLNANKITANTFLGNQIVAGTIQAAQIASGAITARVLAVGNGDSIIPDAGFNDITYWNASQANGVLNANVSLIPTNGSWPSASNNLLAAVGNNVKGDFGSPFFPAEIGATYRVRLYFFAGPDFSGYINPVMHIPGSVWKSLRSGASIDPNVNYGASGHGYTAPTGGVIATEFNVIIPEIDPAKRTQLVFFGQFTGSIQAYATIVRVSDTTLIKDGAITTDKIVVNSILGDRIQAGTLDASKITAGTISTDRLSLGLREQTVNNILNIDFWGKRAIGDNTPGISPNQASANSWYLGSSPMGASQMLLQMEATTDNANGGWNYGSTIDSTKTYRYYTWVQWSSSRPLNNNIYHGIDNIQLMNGGNAENPYFFAFTKNQFQADKWYLMVGVVHPANTFAGNSDISGLYDPSTGRRVLAGSDFRWRPGATSTNFRSYQFYGSLNGLAWFTEPVVEVVVPGVTPSIKSLMQNLDYASNINTGSTLILPGSISVEGSATLSTWKAGPNSAEIRGSAIAANTVSANKLTVGNRGVRVDGIRFQYNRSTGNLDWSAGNIFWVDDNGTPQASAVAAGASGWGGGNIRYIWWNKNAPGVLQQATDNWYNITLDENTIMLCTWRNGPYFVANYGGTIIDGDNITTGSINADRIRAGTVLAQNIIIGEGGGTTLGNVSSTIRGINDDNTLTPAEKGVLSSLYTSINRQDATYYDRATAYVNIYGNRYGVTDFRNAMRTNRDQFIGYVNNLGLLNDYSTNSSYDASYLRNIYDSFEYHCSNLQRVLQQLAAESADWALVGGANRPQDNATHGAPVNTYVGGTLSQNIESWSNDPASRINVQTTTISGGKITTGSIGADKIVANSITGDRIAANTITSDKILVNSLSAISANIGSLVSYNGSGGRVERDGNGTRVYGNNGVLRVKIGF